MTDQLELGYWNRVLAARPNPRRVTKVRATASDLYAAAAHLSRVDWRGDKPEVDRLRSRLVCLADCMDAVDRANHDADVAEFLATHRPPEPGGREWSAAS